MGKVLGFLAFWATKNSDSHVVRNLYLVAVVVATERMIPLSVSTYAFLFYWCKNIRFFPLKKGLASNDANGSRLAQAEP